MRLRFLNLIIEKTNSQISSRTTVLKSTIVDKPHKPTRTRNSGQNIVHDAPCLLHILLELNLHTSVSLFLFYFIFAKKKLLVLSKSANSDSAAHSASSNKMYRQLSPRDESAETWKQLISAYSKFKKVWTCTSTPSYAFTGRYVRPHHSILQKHCLTEAQLFTADTLSFINNWYEFRSPHPTFTLPPCYYYRKWNISQFGVTVFSIVNTYQVLWIQVDWFKSWQREDKRNSWRTKALFRFLDGKKGAVHNYPSKFGTHFLGRSAQDFGWTRQMYLLSINLKNALNLHRKEEHAVI